MTSTTTGRMHPLAAVFGAAMKALDHELHPLDVKVTRLALARARREVSDLDGTSAAARVRA